MRGRVAKALRGISRDWRSYDQHKKKFRALRRAGEVVPIVSRVGARALKRAARNGQTLIGFANLPKNVPNEQLFRISVLRHPNGVFEVIA